jgi:hypothetical protein
MFGKVRDYCFYGTPEGSSFDTPLSEMFVLLGAHSQQVIRLNKADAYKNRLSKDAPVSVALGTDLDIGVDSPRNTEHFQPTDTTGFNLHAANTSDLA